MPKIFKDIKLGLDEDIEEKLQYLMPEGHGDYRVLRQSIDARRSRAAHFVMTLEVAKPGEQLPKPEFKLDKVNFHGEPPIIIGSGPAGLFAAIRFVERGIPCRLFERGSESGKRIIGINRYWRHGELDPRNNVCFGEGGAGLYSDGKLITRIKSPHIPYVMNRLVQFGAPEEIEYLANPHVGSDRIRRVIPKIRNFLAENGCEIHYDTQVTELLRSGNQITGIKTEHGTVFHSNHIVLATGHSAEDMFRHLEDIGVFMEGKSFALGLRIEHSQKLINQIQLRDLAEHPKLGSANYKVAYNQKETGLGIYSFCMCPGGYVLSSGTEADGIVANGMSNYKRNSPFANAAIVTTVDFDKRFGQSFDQGLKWRRQIEQDFFNAVRASGGTKELPGQRVSDFFDGKTNELGPTSSPSGAIATRLDQLLPDWIRDALKEGLSYFNSKLPGFVSHEAQLYGVESRTSCPIRVTRHPETLESLSHQGLYPTGEGAGYAGGITSAACDGIRVAEAIINQLSHQAVTDTLQ